MSLLRPSWLQMRYPMTTSTRAKLVRFYYELCLLPGLDVRVIRSWADMISRLLGKNVKRKLESKDLQLSWRPLWRVLYKELFPKKRLGQTKYATCALSALLVQLTQFSSRNLNNILLYVAESCRWYFPASDIPDMLDTFLPMVTPDVSLDTVCRYVLTPPYRRLLPWFRYSPRSFLPPTRTSTSPLYSNFGNHSTPFRWMIVSLKWLEIWLRNTLQARLAISAKKAVHSGRTLVSGLMRNGLCWLARGSSPCVGFLIPLITHNLLTQTAIQTSRLENLE
jgi:hypothetical protein